MRRNLTWVLVVLLAAFVAARIAVLTGGQIFTSHDTFSYAYRTDPSFNRGPLVSFTGDAPRLWGVPLFYALFPTDTARAAGQWALATSAWIVLAVVVWASVRSTVARVLGAAGLLGLGLAAPVTNWDFAILSESLTVSLGVLTVAGLLWWLRTGSRTALIGMCVAGLWWTFTRPDIRVFTVLLVALPAVVAWRNRSRRVPALVAAGVLAVATLWCTVILPRVDRSFEEYSATAAVGYEEGLLVYRLRLHVLPHADVKAAFQRDFGLPGCAPAEEIAAGPEWRTVEFVDAYTRCPELRDWGRRNAGDVWTRFAVEEPALYASYLRDTVVWSLRGPVYAKVPRVLPARLEKAAFPPGNRALYVVVAGLAVSLGVALAAGAARRRRLLFAAGIGLAAASVASLLAGIQFGAGEYNRFGVQEVVGLRLAVLLLLVAAVDAAVERWRERRAGPGEPVPAEPAPDMIGYRAPSDAGSTDPGEADGRRDPRRDGGERVEGRRVPG